MVLGALCAVPALVQSAYASDELHRVLAMEEETLSIYYEYFGIMGHLSSQSMTPDEAASVISDLAQRLERLRKRIEEAVHQLSEQDGDAYWKYLESNERMECIKKIDERMNVLNEAAQQQRHYASEALSAACKKFIRSLNYG